MLIVLLNNEVVDDEFLSFWGVFPHVIIEQFFDVRLLTQDYRLDANVGANKSGEFIGRNFPQSLESCDFWFVAQLGDGIFAFFFGIAVDGFFLVSNPEKRCS